MPGPSRRARVAASLAVGLLGAACVRTGDLGRPRPSPLGEEVLPAVGASAARERGEPASLHPFTDDEAELRDRAWRFLMPARERWAFERQLAELARTRAIPPLAPLDEPAAYHEALTDAPVRSPASLYATLAGDAEADARLVGPFAENAVRVFAADRHRLAALSAMPGIEPPFAREAVVRVAENRCLVAWVRHRAEARSVAYRYALDHLFVGTPQGQAVGAERATRMLLAHRRALDGLLAPGEDCAGFAAVPARGPRPVPLVAKG